MYISVCVYVCVSLYVRYPGEVYRKVTEKKDTRR